MFKRHIHTAAILCFAMAFMVSCTGKKQDSEQAAGGSMPPMPVKVKIASPVSLPDYTEYIATLQSRSASVLQPDQEGLVTKIMVKSGDRVNTGDLLFQIDPVRQEASLNAFEATRRARQANLDLAKKELERRKSLFAAGVIPKQDLDQAQTAFDSAQGDVESVDAVVHEQKVQLRYYSVLAPTVGVIGDIPIRQGDHVTKTTVLTTIDSGNELEAYINIPAEKAPLAHEGMSVVLLGADGKPASYSKVSSVSPRVDTTNQLLLIKASVANADHRYKNMEQMRVQVQWNTRPQETIPVLAVSRLGGQFFAFIAEPTDATGKNFVARQRALQLGDINGNEYVVLDGVKAGDRIILSGTQMLRDGAPVSLLP